MAEGCAETGAMQTAVQQCDIVSNGGGNPKSPDAFRHFGAQNDIFFVLEQSLFLFKGFIKNTTKKS